MTDQPTTEAHGAKANNVSETITDSYGITRLKAEHLCNNAGHQRGSEASERAYGVYTEAEDHARAESVAE